jgi:hypothetical protein
MPLICCARRRWPMAAAARFARVSLCLAAIYVLMAPRPVGAEQTSKATWSRAARREAIQAIPLDHLSPADQDGVRFVLNHTTLYRRLPVKQIECDPQLFLFLVRHPEVLVNIWEVLGVSNVSLRRSGPNTFLASDGQGTLGNVKILRDEPNWQLMYAEGAYEGPLLKWPVRGKCVLLLRVNYQRRNDGRYQVTGQLDSFTHIDRVAVELLAKTFQPLVGLAADYNFTETMNFVGDLSQATERNPRGIASLYQKLNHIDPETRRQLLQVSQNVVVRSSRSQAQLRPQSLSLARSSHPVAIEIRRPRQASAP